MTTSFIRIPSLLLLCSALLAACSTSPGPTASQADVSPTPPTPKSVQPGIVATIDNPGFENKWEAWDEIPDSGDFTAISDDSNSGNHSAKITEDGGRFEQTVAVQPNTDYEVSAFIQGSGEIGIELPAETISSKPEGAGEAWLPLTLSFNTGEATEVVIYGAYKSGEARIDDFSIASMDES